MSINMDFEKALEDIKFKKEMQEFNGMSYDYDFEKNEFIMYKGNPVVVYGKQAVAIWIEKVLRTVEDVYDVYTEYLEIDNYGYTTEKDYGNRLKEIYFGQKLPHLLIESEVEREIRETMALNQYIKRIEKLEIDYEGTNLIISFVVILFDDDELEIKMDMGKQEVDINLE